MSICEPDVLALTGAATGKNPETVNLILSLKFHDIRTVLPGTFVLFCLSEMWKEKKNAMLKKMGLFYMESIAFPSEKPTIQPFWNLVRENQIILAKAT